MASKVQTCVPLSSPEPQHPDFKHPTRASVPTKVVGLREAAGSSQASAPRRAHPPVPGARPLLCRVAARRNGRRMLVGGGSVPRDSVSARCLPATIEASLSTKRGSPHEPSPYLVDSVSNSTAQAVRSRRAPRNVRFRRGMRLGVLQSARCLPLARHPSTYRWSASLFQTSEKNQLLQRGRLASAGRSPLAHVCNGVSQ